MRTNSVAATNETPCRYRFEVESLTEATLCFQRPARALSLSKPSSKISYESSAPLLFLQ